MLANIRREEFKYYLSLSHEEPLLRSLGHFMRLDPACENEKGCYTVKSLYFDTPDSKDLTDKLDGLIDREKFRLRTYSSPLNESVFKLERKCKADNVIGKTSLTLSRAHAVALQSGDYHCLNQLGDPFADFCYQRFTSQGYRPRVIVEYDRSAFTLPFGNIRVTLDSGLRTYNGCLDVVTRRAPKVDVFLDRMSVLEIKFEKYLPAHLQEILSFYPLKRCAISKYVLCNVHLANGPWSDELIRPF